MDDSRFSQISNPDNKLLSEEVLKSYLRKKLPHYMVPSRFIFIDNIPLNSNGKVDYKQLEIDLKKPSPPTTKDYHFPQNVVEFELSKIWKKILDKFPIGRWDHFAELGGDSLSILKLSLEVEKVFSSILTPTDLLQKPLLCEQAQLICGGHEPKTPFILEIKKQLSGKRPPLYFIHPAAGLSFPYIPLAEHMDEQSIYGLNNPNLGNENHAFRSLKEMAKYYLEGILNKEKNKTFILAGWSFGGNLSYEMAYQLECMGRMVPFIILFDSFNYASYPKTLLPHQDPQKVLPLFQINTNSSKGKALSFEMKNNQTLAYDYTPKQISSRILLIKAGQSEPLYEKLCQKPCLGWSKLSKTKCQKFTFESNHSSMFYPSKAKSLASLLNLILRNQIPLYPSNSGLKPELRI